MNQFQDPIASHDGIVGQSEKVLQFRRPIGSLRFEVIRVRTQSRRLHRQPVTFIQVLTQPRLEGYETAANSDAHRAGDDPGRDQQAERNAEVRSQISRR